MANQAYLVTAAQLASVLDDPGIRLVDCRFELTDPEAGRRSYDEGHIPGAVYADLDMDLAGPAGAGAGRHPLPDPAKLAATFARFGIGSDTRVIAYDEGPGAVAARAWWLLRWLGHENAAVLDGGFSAWLASGGATESDVPRVTRGSFTPAPREQLVLQTPEIIRAGAMTSGLTLIDARARERYTGAEEPIDPVAGHIPGTVSLPFTENVRDDGHWRSPAEIRDRLAPLIGEPCGQEWAVMCGSGVTACHLVIGGLLAGYAEPRVYVGSWSEWISDPSRPTATGPR